MKALVLRRRGGGGGVRVKKKASGRGFMCGCGGSKALVVSDGSEKQSPMATPPAAHASSAATSAVATTTSAATAKATRRARSSSGASSKAASVSVSTAAAHSSSFSPSSTDDADGTSSGSTPSVAALLRQLGELERTVRSLQQGAAGTGGRRHKRAASEGGGGLRRVEESVAVVKESADPLADFRRSMLQMIVEKEIVGGAELRDLLHRFLSLNSPRHHHLILRAFAEIWEEVFSGYKRSPDFLVSHGKKQANHTAAAAAAADKWAI